MTATDVPTGNFYDKYATANPVERRLVHRFLARVDALLPMGEVRRVLEVGTGEGHVAARVRTRYPDAFVTGIDLPDADLAAHWHDARLPAAYAVGAHLPFPDRTFDLVLGIEVLEHTADPASVLAEIARVARASVLLTVPREPVWRLANMTRGKYLRHLGNTPGHIQHWSRSGFRDLAARYLDVTAAEGSFPWTLVAAQRRRG